MLVVVILRVKGIRDYVHVSVNDSNEVNEVREVFLNDLNISFCRLAVLNDPTVRKSDF